MLPHACGAWQGISDLRASLGRRGAHGVGLVVVFWLLSVAAVWWSPCAAASRHRPPHLLTNLLLALRCPPPAENTACIIQCIIKILYYTYTRYTTKLPRIVLPWLPNDLRGPKNRVRRLSGSDIVSVLSRRLLPLQWWLAVDPPDDTGRQRGGALPWLLCFRLSMSSYRRYFRIAVSLKQGRQPASSRSIRCDCLQIIRMRATVERKRLYFM